MGAAAASGAHNMAVDEALLDSVAAGESVPVLRLYGWSPPCLSLGYAQRAADADHARIAARGWGIVRRPTGGKAILHADELTYSLTLPLSHPIAAGDIVESYRRISRALMVAIQNIGLDPNAERMTADKRSIGPVCFETPSHYEITTAGRKLVGSAQLRRKATLLQHGSLPLTGDPARICDALHYPDETSREAARARVRERAATLSQAAGREIDWKTAAAVLVDAFSGVFAVELTPDTLTPPERERVERLTVHYQVLDIARSR